MSPDIPDNVTSGTCRVGRRVSVSLGSSSRGTDAFVSGATYEEILEKLAKLSLLAIDALKKEKREQRTINPYNE